MGFLNRIPFTISRLNSMVISFIRVVILGLMLVNPGPDTDWKIRRDVDGVMVSTRKVAGSPFEEFRAEMNIPNTSLTKVLDVIMDVKSYPQNFPNCGGAKVLEQKSKYHDIHYLIISTPWPVANRDAIYEANTTFSSNGKYARISLVPLGNYIAVDPKYIRVYNGSGFWELQEADDHVVKVVYQFHADPGGEIPGWIANSVIVINPYKTLESLRNIVTGKQN
ncbi:MAG: START domain-containing protein [Marinilabiliales bacterium]|nr:START domain-containing protein [Marinilabiliales bacterium]